MASMKYIKVYYDLAETLDLLSDPEAGRLFKAVLSYARTGDVAELPGQEKLVFAMLRSQIDRDRENYDDISEKRSAAGKLGGRPQKANALEEKQKKQMLSDESKKSYNKDQNKDEYKDQNKDEDGITRARAEIPAASGADLASLRTEEIERDNAIEREIRNAGFRATVNDMRFAHELAAEYTDAWLFKALLIAIERGNPKWDFVRGILKRMREQGGPDAKRPPLNQPAGAARPVKEVAKHRYDQRQYSEEELDALFCDIMADGGENNA